MNMPLRALRTCVLKCPPRAACAPATRPSAQDNLRCRLAAGAAAEYGELPVAVPTLGTMAREISSMRCGEVVSSSKVGEAMTCG